VSEDVDRQEICRSGRRLARITEGVEAIQIRNVQEPRPRMEIKGARLCEQAVLRFKRRDEICGATVFVEMSYVNCPCFSIKQKQPFLDQIDRYIATRRETVKSRHHRQNVFLQTRRLLKSANSLRMPKNDPVAEMGKREHVRHWRRRKRTRG
jgi:hypothetical protein